MQSQLVQYRRQRASEAAAAEAEARVAAGRARERQLVEEPLEERRATLARIRQVVAPPPPVLSLSTLERRLLPLVRSARSRVPTLQPCPNAAAVAAAPPPFQFRVLAPDRRSVVRCDDARVLMHRARIDGIDSLAQAIGPWNVPRLLARWRVVDPLEGVHDALPAGGAHEQLAAEIFDRETWVPAVAEGHPATAYLDEAILAAEARTPEEIGIRRWTSAGALPVTLPAALYERWVLAPAFRAAESGEELVRVEYRAPGAPAPAPMVVVATRLPSAPGASTIPFRDLAGYRVDVPARDVRILGLFQPFTALRVESADPDFAGVGFGFVANDYLPPQAVPAPNTARLPYDLAFRAQGPAWADSETTDRTGPPIVVWPVTLPLAVRMVFDRVTEDAIEYLNDTEEAIAVLNAVLALHRLLVIDGLVLLPTRMFARGRTRPASLVPLRVATLYAYARRDDELDYEIRSVPVAALPQLEPVQIEVRTTLGGRTWPTTEAFLVEGALRRPYPLFGDEPPPTPEALQSVSDRVFHEGLPRVLAGRFPIPITPAEAATLRASPVTPAELRHWRAALRRFAGPPRETPPADVRLAATSPAGVYIRVPGAATPLVYRYAVRDRRWYLVGGTDSGAPRSDADLQSLLQDRFGVVYSLVPTPGGPAAPTSPAAAASAEALLRDVAALDSERYVEESPGIIDAAARRLRLPVYVVRGTVARDWTTLARGETQDLAARRITPTLTVLQLLRQVLDQALGIDDDGFTQVLELANNDPEWREAYPNALISASEALGALATYLYPTLQARTEPAVLGGTDLDSVVLRAYTTLATAPPAAPRGVRRPLPPESPPRV